MRSQHLPVMSTQGAVGSVKGAQKEAASGPHIQSCLFWSVLQMIAGTQNYPEHTSQWDEWCVGAE